MHSLSSAHVSSANLRLRAHVSSANLPAFAYHSVDEVLCMEDEIELWLT